MDLTKHFQTSLQKKNYDSRIEVVRQTSSEVGALGEEAWVLLEFCRQFIVYLESNLLPSHSNVKGSRFCT